VTPSAVALVPARAGSLRVPGKNVRVLSGHPLMAYSIAGAFESGVFDAVVVSTDSPDVADIGRHYGAEVPELRPAELATSTSPDIAWVRHMLGVLADAGREYELFSIVRPTSPCRSAATIRRAFDELVAQGDEADSIRAVERCRQHPAKMWTLDGDFIRPLLSQPSGEVPLHSRQFQALPEVFVQDSSLEIAWSRVTADGLDIAGPRVLGLVSEGWDGFSIDYPDDWERVEAAIAAGEAKLPAISLEPMIAQP
jgi:CMP-N,N'-diacetyllegionaminic acid synthase